MATCDHHQQKCCIAKANLAKKYYQRGYFMLCAVLLLVGLESLFFYWWQYISYHVLCCRDRDAILNFQVCSGDTCTKEGRKGNNITTSRRVTDESINNQGTSAAMSTYTHKYITWHSYLFMFHFQLIRKKYVEENIFTLIFS